jgi:hypothetical protein
MDADLRLEREGGRCVDSMNIEPPHEPRWACKRPKPWWRCHRRMVDRDSLGDGRVRVMASGLKDHETLGCCAKRPKHGRPGVDLWGSDRAVRECWDATQCDLARGLPGNKGPAHPGSTKSTLGTRRCILTSASPSRRVPASFIGRRFCLPSNFWQRAINRSSLSKDLIPR